MEKEFWKNKYEMQATAWNINGYSTPLIEYIDSITDKNAKILIPGNGMSHDAMYAYSKGYKNIFVCDWIEKAKKEFFNRFPTFPTNQFILRDFFELEDSFDYIIEQTFFCALHPKERLKYLQKTKQLLRNDGYFSGVLFNHPFSEEGPPFGGQMQYYKELFSNYFEIEKLELCYNSIKPRKNRELFFVCRNTVY